MEKFSLVVMLDSNWGLVCWSQMIFRHFGWHETSKKTCPYWLKESIILGQESLLQHKQDNEQVGVFLEMLERETQGFQHFWR